jgi:hypothetical protein
MKKKLLVSLCFLLTLTFASANKSWNFRTWSQATWDLLAADAASESPLWRAGTVTGGTRYESVATLAGPLLANGQEIAETKGLRFGAFGDAKCRIDNGTAPAGRLMLNGAGLTMIIPGCVAGSVITIVTLTGNTTSARGITATNCTRLGGLETSMDSITNIFKVVATDSVVITTVVGGSHIRNIDIAGNYHETAVHTPSVSATVVKSEFYSISGILVGNNFANLKRGLYIQKTFYNDGSISKSKFVKSLD